MCSIKLLFNWCGRFLSCRYLGSLVEYLALRYLEFLFQIGEPGQRILLALYKVRKTKIMKRKPIILQVVHVER